MSAPSPTKILDPPLVSKVETFYFKHDQCTPFLVGFSFLQIRYTRIVFFSRFNSIKFVSLKSKDFNIDSSYLVNNHSNHHKLRKQKEKRPLHFIDFYPWVNPFVKFVQRDKTFPNTATSWA